MDTFDGTLPRGILYHGGKKIMECSQKNVRRVIDEWKNMTR